MPSDELRVNSVDKTGRTALMYVGQSGLVRTFIDILASVKDVDVNVQDPTTGNTALLWLIMSSPPPPAPTARQLASEEMPAPGGRAQCRYGSRRDLEMAPPRGLYWEVARDNGFDWWESGKEPTAREIEDLLEMSFSVWNMDLFLEIRKLWLLLLSHGLDVTTRNKEGYNCADLAKKHLGPRCAQYITELAALGRSCTKEDLGKIRYRIGKENRNATKD